MKKKFSSLLAVSSLLFVTAVQSQPNTYPWPSSGFVGIGTNSPQQRLHVEGPSNQAIFVNTSAVGPISGSGMIGYVKGLPTAAGNRLGYFLLGSRGGANFNYNVAGMVGYAGDAWTATSHPAYLAFETTPSGATSRVERVRILDNGNVGIGTTSPSYKLQVDGNGSYSTGLYVGDGGTFSYNSGGAGLYGSGSSYGTFGTSPVTGVYGQSTSSGYGVQGVSGYIGVLGQGTASSGSYGLYGLGSYGVYGSGSTYGVYGTGGPYGVYGNGSSYGLWGNSSSYGAIGIGGTYGTYGRGTSYGLYGVGGTYGTFSSGTSYGVYGISTDGWGVRGYSTNSIGGDFYSLNSWGLYAATGRTDNNYAAVFDGNVICYNSYLGSDRSLKQNIEEFTDALGIINKLKPKNYEFRHDGQFAEANLPVGRHYGLIAQELEEVLPNLVKEAPAPRSKSKLKGIEPIPLGENAQTGVKVENETKESATIKAVNYTELIPILVKGMQELSKENKDLRQELTELQIRINKLPNGQSMTASGTLLQNSPNPVRNSTTILYSIPEGVTRAQLVITDALGRTVKTFSLNRSGVVNFNSSFLASGVYNYSLIADNKTIETRKMIVEK